MTWAANMALSTQTGVPWVMCKDTAAPDPIVSSLLGFQPWNLDLAQCIWV